MAAHLFKTEPGSYSFDDLVREGRARWDGVSNPVALRNVGNVRRGDTVAIYHTGKEKCVVGLARAVGDPYPDPRLNDPKVFVVDLEPVRRLAQLVPLATFKTDPVLRTVAMVRQPRLSVMPISDAQLERILELAGGGRR